MPAYSTYRLTFRSALHIGERGVELEVTRTHVPADTLFSAICSAWRELYGVDALRRDVLDRFTESDSAPFLLSSAFPFAGGVRFFPRPFARLAEVESESEKAFKRVTFVSEGQWTAMINGGKPIFNKEHCINGEVVWVTEGEKERLKGWTDDATGKIVIWKTNVLPRVTLDRITSAAQIWHFGEVMFAEGVGLWFAVEFNRDHGDELRRKFGAVLRLLGDSGLGGERSAGRGLFSISGPRDELLSDGSNPDCFVTLSPLCPHNAAEVSTLTGSRAAYGLIPRRGWVTSPEASNLRRKMVWMFAEGSVLTGSPASRAGCLANVKPNACPHDVWRYGYAFPVGVAGSAI